MAIEFVNETRSYDSTRECVSFWGHDVTLEVTFRVDRATLCNLAGISTLSEDAALMAFDANIVHIRDVARKLYLRNPKSFWDLSPTDM